MARWYEVRSESLRQMGIPDYRAYLRTQFWKDVRERVMVRCKGLCEACGGRATEVHHRSYVLAVMLGERIDLLVACCRGCHEEAEFDAGRKVRPRVANKRMAVAALGVGRVLPHLCHACRHNPTKVGRRLCGRCEREGRDVDPRVTV